jgi:hypothetical protein
VVEEKFVLECLNVTQQQLHSYLRRTMCFVVKSRSHHVHGIEAVNKYVKENFWQPNEKWKSVRLFTQNYARQLIELTLDSQRYNQMSTAASTYFPNSVNWRQLISRTVRCQIGSIQHMQSSARQVVRHVRWNEIYCQTSERAPVTSSTYWMHAIKIPLSRNVGGYQFTAQ